LSKTKLTLALLLISIFAFQSYIVFAQPPEGEPPPIGTTVKWRMLNETKKDVWNWTDVEWMYGPSPALEYRYLNDTLCDSVQRNQTFKIIVYVPFTIMNSTMFKSAHVHFHLMRDLAKEMADITARFMQSRLVLVAIAVIAVAVIVSVVYIWRRKKKRMMALEAPMPEAPRPEGPPGPSSPPLTALR